MEHKCNTSIMGWVRQWRTVEEGQGCEQFFVIHTSRVVHRYGSVNRQSYDGEDSGSTYGPGELSDTLLQAAEPHGLGVLEDGLCRAHPE